MTTTINEYLLIPPNWANPVVYRRRWQTTLTSSLKADESRSAIFTWPRRTLSFTPLAKNFTESAYIKRKLHKSLDGVWGVPFWMDRTVLTSQANSGDNHLHVGSTLYRNFEVGASCILIKMVNGLPVSEVRVVGSLPSDAQINLATNLGATWIAGTEVYPLIKARIKSGQVINLLGSRFSQMEIEGTEEYDNSDEVIGSNALNYTCILSHLSAAGNKPITGGSWATYWTLAGSSGASWVNATIYFPGVTRRIGNASGFPTYKGYPIFDIQPDWAEQGEFSLINPYDQLSYFGKSVALSEYDETELLLKLNFLERQKSDIQKVLDFFDSRMGRWGNFWTPSWQSDIRVTAAFGSGDNHLHIEDIEFLDYWLDTGAGTYITVLFPDGTRINRQVIAAPSSTTLTLDDFIGKACSGSSLDGLLVSFLLFGRFNQDEIEVGYLTDAVGKLNLTFQTLFSEGFS